MDKTNSYLLLGDQITLQFQHCSTVFLRLGLTGLRSCCCMIWWNRREWNNKYQQNVSTRVIVRVTSWWCYCCLHCHLPFCCLWQRNSKKAERPENTDMKRLRSKLMYRETSCHGEAHFEGPLSQWQALGASRWSWRTISTWKMGIKHHHIQVLSIIVDIGIDSTQDSVDGQSRSQSIFWTKRT
jgi:hypothetical protein